MAVRTTLVDVVPEKSTAQVTGKIQDEAGVAIPSASLTTLKLTLYVDGFPSAIINSRNAQDVLNANGGAVDSSGNLTWTAAIADNAIIDPLADEEKHIALFEWTWNAGAKAGRQEIVMTISNFKNVS